MEIRTENKKKGINRQKAQTHAFTQTNLTMENGSVMNDAGTVTTSLIDRGGRPTKSQVAIAYHLGNPEIMDVEALAHLEDELAEMPQAPSNTPSSIGRHSQQTPRTQQDGRTTIPRSNHPNAAMFRSPGHEIEDQEEDGDEAQDEEEEEEEEEDEEEEDEEEEGEGVATNPQANGYDEYGARTAFIQMPHSDTIRMDNRRREDSAKVPENPFMENAPKTHPASSHSDREVSAFTSSLEENVKRELIQEMKELCEDYEMQMPVIDEKASSAADLERMLEHLHQEASEKAWANRMISGFEFACTLVENAAKSRPTFFGNFDGFKTAMTKNSNRWRRPLQRIRRRNRPQRHGGYIRPADEIARSIASNAAKWFQEKKMPSAFHTIEGSAKRENKNPFIFETPAETKRVASVRNTSLAHLMPDAESDSSSDSSDSDSDSDSDAGAARESKSDEQQDLPPTSSNAQAENTASALTSIISLVSRLEERLERTESAMREFMARTDQTPPRHHPSVPFEQRDPDTRSDDGRSVFTTMSRPLTVFAAGAN